MSLLLLLASCVSSPRAHGPLEEYAYVWQHQWTAPVIRAVHERGPSFARLLLLAAELSWEEQRARVVKIALPECSGRGLVVRVAVPPVDPVPVLADLFSELTRTCRPLELQLDLDIPTSRLGEYVGWVSQLEQQIEPVPLTVTTLPTWLSEPAFGELIEAADGYVLQVHWLPPESGPLLDPLARDHLEEAARWGRPLRLALPTYGYQRLLDEQGRVRGVVAEQGRVLSPSETVRAEPARVAALVAELVRDRPAELQGLVWFRLPVDSDVLAWSWPALVAVREGREPRALPRVSLQQDGPSWTVRLHNDGEDDLPLPTLQLPSEVQLAGGVGTYSWSLGLHRLVPAGGAALRPGDERVVGWVMGSEAPVISVGEP